MARRSHLALAALALLALAAQPALADARFLGRWAVQSFGQSQDLIFHFLDATHMLVDSGGETEEQLYSVDSNLGHMTLTMGSGEVVLRYAWIDADTFALFMTDDLLDQMTAAFTGSLPQGTNPLTDQIIEEMKYAIRDVFSRNPFMQGTRL